MVVNKLLQQTDSQRPHRCCPLANKVDNIDCGNICPTTTPQSATSRWGSKPPPNVWFIRGPHESKPRTSASRGRFSRVGTTHDRVQQIHKDTDDAIASLMKCSSFLPARRYASAGTSYCPVSMSVCVCNCLVTSRCSIKSAVRINLFFFGI